MVLAEHDSTKHVVRYSSPSVDAVSVESYPEIMNPDFRSEVLDILRSHPVDAKFVAPEYILDFFPVALKFVSTAKAKSKERFTVPSLIWFGRLFG